MFIFFKQLALIKYCVKTLFTIGMSLFVTLNLFNYFIINHVFQLIALQLLIATRGNE